MRDLSRPTLGALAALFCLAAPVAALAHDIWVVPQAQGSATVGWVRFGDPSRLELADYHKVVSLDLVTPTGRVNLKRPLAPAKGATAPALETKPFTAPVGSILAIAYDNGYYAVSPLDGVESNTSKLLMPDGKESVWVPKFGKTLLGAGSYALRTHTLLELVPLSDPYAARGKLAVRLEHKGRPVTGVAVTFTDGLASVDEKKRPSVTTDGNGVVEIDIARKGAWLLTADYLGPPSSPDLADHDEIYATLAFDTSK